MPNHPPQVQIPAAHLNLTGLKAEFHAQRHLTKLHSDKYRFDCGFDLFPSSGPYEVEEHNNFNIIMVCTALHAFIPPGAFGWVTDRSSSTKLLEGGWIMDGKIDATYTGELIIRVGCHVKDIDHVTEVIGVLAVRQIAIAQLVLCGTILANPVCVSALPQIGRGNAGFGSTNPK